MALIQPFDIQSLFVNVFAGNVAIFVAMLLLCVVILAAKFKMPTIVVGSLILLLGIFLAANSGYEWFYLTVIIIAAITATYNFMRLLKN